MHALLDPNVAGILYGLRSRVLNSSEIFMDASHRKAVGSVSVVFEEGLCGVAYDALTVVVHPANNWAGAMTVTEESTISLEKCLRIDD
jgi:hypothetical protein